MPQHQQIPFIPAVATALVIPAALVALAGCGSRSQSSSAPKTVSATGTGSTPTPTPTVASPKPKLGPQTFVLTEHDTKLIYTPKGGVPTATAPKGQPQPGDRTAIAGELLRGTAKVGSLRYTDEFETGNRVRIQGTLVLANGQFTVAGLVPLVEPTVIPIVSSTGNYAGLTGTLIAAGVSADNAKLTIELR